MSFSKKKRIILPFCFFLSRCGSYPFLLDFWDGPFRLGVGPSAKSLDLAVLDVVPQPLDCDATDIVGATE